MNKFKAGVLTVSDSAAKTGGRQDTSGPIVVDLLKKAGFAVVAMLTVADETKDIASCLKEWSDNLNLDLVLTTGGTGVFPRDVTPEATAEVLDRDIPGIPEAMRIKGLEQTPMSMLSRGVAGVRGKTLIINLPGSPSAVRDGLETVMPALRHAINKINGDPTPCVGSH